MRAFFVFFVLAAQSVFVTHAIAQPASLKEVMAEIEMEMRAISSQVDDQDANSDSQARSLKMRKLFVLSFSFEPPKAQRVPEAERPALLRAYDKFLGRAVVATTDLEESFANNNKQQSKTLLAEINLLRREAHTLLR